MVDKKVIANEDGVKVTERSHNGLFGWMLGQGDYRIDDEDTGKYYIRDRRDDANPGHDAIALPHLNLTSVKPGGEPHAKQEHSQPEYAILSKMVRGK